MTVLSPWEIAARAFESDAPRRWRSPGDLAKYLDPRTVQTPALDLIDAELVRMADEPDQDHRLIVTMAPQEGKSQRVAIATPTWWLCERPDDRVAVASYGQKLATRNGRSIRRLVTEHPELGLRVAADNGAANEWEIAGHDGGVLSVGIGGGFSGRPVDCVSGDTYIECERGRIPAAEAFTQGVRRILAFDHASGRAVWRDVEAARRIPGRRVVEVTTQSGRRLICTPDHRVYTGRGYIPAGSLRDGDTLLGVVAGNRVSMRPDVHDSQAGRAQGDPSRTVALLLAGVREARDSRITARSLLRVRKPDSEITGRLLLGRMPRSSGAAPQSDVPTVFSRVLPEAHQRNVLLPGVCQCGPLGTDGRHGQRSLRGRQELRQVVPVDAAADPRTRRAPVCGVRRVADVDVHQAGAGGGEVGSCGASRRPRHPEQSTGEPDHALPNVSHGAPQVEYDTVAMVRSRGDEEIPVYDFQVAGTHNFFGDGLLVHNCLIIDDPIKDRKEADSEVYRQAVWDWWTDVASARFGPVTRVVLILTRWHDDDLAGRLLAAEDGDLWRVVNIPAQADHNPAKGETDILGREPGEFMISARGRTQAQWERRKRTAGPRTWAALYQGDPSPAEGDTFKRDLWKRYTEPLWVVRDDGSRVVPDAGAVDLLMSWDMAFKDLDSSDYVVGQVWLRRGADAYLLDQVRGRFDFPETCRQFKLLVARWPQVVLKVVEDKANGPAVIASLRHQIPGIVPEEPDGSKEARAAAITPLLHAGNLWLPASTLAPWADELIEEAAAFPKGKNDDMVDSMSQAIKRLILDPLVDVDDDIDDDVMPQLGWAASY